MLQVLHLPQFGQKKHQISLRDNKLFDMVVQRVVVLAKALSDGRFSGAVIAGQTLRNQERPMGEILWKVLAEIEN